LKAELFLAWRYLKPQRNVAAVITVISIVGVTLGVAVLMVVLAVMTGFTDLFTAKLLDTQAHFQVRPMYGSSPIRRPGKVAELLKKNGATAAAPVVLQQALAQVGRTLDPRVIVLGVDANETGSAAKLRNALRCGTLDLERREVAISTDMAVRWNLHLGEKLLLHSPAKLTGMVKIDEKGHVTQNEEAPVYLPGEYTVKGLYHMGKSDFDRCMIFMRRSDAGDLFELPLGSATAVYGWLPDPMKAQPFVNRINQKLDCSGVRAFSWQEMNANLLGVLAVEKNMMFFLLIFIVLVAAFSITNTLITSVYKKTREIGILKSLGASDGSVMRIFILQGMLVGILGSSCGTLLGYLVVTFRHKILHFASLLAQRNLFPKEFYFFDGLPAHIVTSDVLLIVAVSILLCTLGGVLPALRAAKLDPAKALRYE